jgi:hypothetical protein
MIEYLRNQASRCMSLARVCFDLETARQLRLLAEDLKAKADEIEGKARPQARLQQGSPPEQWSGPRRRNSAPIRLSACPQGEACPCELEFSVSSLRH